MHREAKKNIRSNRPVLSLNAIFLGHLWASLFLAQPPSFPIDNPSKQQEHLTDGA